MSKETLQQELEGIEVDANNYFDIVEAPTDSEDRVPPSELSQRIARIVGELHNVMERSSLFDELDQDTLRGGLRCADAALRLHRYQSWYTHVLHDEDRVLDVAKAGHGEYPIGVSDAREEFRRAIETLRRILIRTPDDAQEQQTTLERSNQEGPLMSVTKFAEEIGKSTKTVKRYVEKGIIQANKNKEGRILSIPRSELDSVLKRRD